MSGLVDENYINRYLKDSENSVDDLKLQIYTLNNEIIKRDKKIGELQFELQGVNYQRYLKLDGIINKLKIVKPILRLCLKVYRGIKWIIRKLLKRNNVSVSASDFKITPNITDKDYMPRYNIKVSVIIPTKNGGDIFERLLKSMAGQLGIKEIEIIVVDSGSSDKTVDISKFLSAKVVSIKPEDFSHSYARNLGAKNASGDYLLFMTQDAVPTDEYWLYKLITPLIDEKVVAASAKEVQLDYGDMKYKIDSYMHNKFLGIEKNDVIGEMHEGISWMEKRKNAQLTDICCIVKKDIFEKYKYSGNFAEDLRLGLNLIENGYKIGLLSSVCVIHAHTRPSSYYMKRNFVDVRTLHDIFPEFKGVCINADELVGAVKKGYIYTENIIEKLSWNGESLEEFLDNLNLVADNTISDGENLNFDNEYQDEVFKNFIINLYNLDVKSCNSDILCNDLKSYIKNALRSYMTEKYSEMNDKLLSEIKETIFKTYCGKIGEYFAYYMINNEKKEEYLREIAIILEKGV